MHSFKGQRKEIIRISQRKNIVTLYTLLRQQLFDIFHTTKHIKKMVISCFLFNQNYHTFSLIFKIIKNGTIKYLLSFLYLNIF